MNRTTALLALTSASFALAGPLTPPPGAVAPTGRTLEQAEPRTPLSAEATPGDSNSVFRITQPGSYYLTGNVVAAADQSGIVIIAPDVTLDLNGFLVSGPAGSAVEGIDSSQQRVHVMNGFVRGFTDGVDLSARGCTVESLTVTGASSNGIDMGIDSRVIGCTATDNGNNGIDAFSRSSVTGCTANANGSFGIRAGSQSSVIDCIASANTGRGITTGTNAVVSRCVANSNMDDGISTGNGAVVESCSARDNADTGFLLGTGVLVDGCNAFSNDGIGFNAGTATRLQGCAAGFNAGGGYRLTSRCSLVGSAADSNSFFGVETTGSSNTVRECDISSSPVAFDLLSNGSALIINNTLASNTVAFTNGTGNTVAPLVTSATIGTSSNPHANYVR
ncbi:MAG: right-handed parallel beta-helix repeat-containing protein [Planctomycetota bacterium]